jgi:methylenetetrahydrofolate--tRNA-(uracil-5-)-methyltransferase
MADIAIIGAGLAGSECAWQIAKAGFSVTLYEMRPLRQTPAHQTDGCAELVCSNSFRSDDAQTNAVGVIHAEMRMAQSLIMACADAHQVPAGSALAVDREGFSGAVTKALQDHPLITLKRQEVTHCDDLPERYKVLATGPLTSDALAAFIAQKTDQSSLAFFDAIAPIVHFDSIDMSVAWFQSRYDKVGPGGTGKDYINCPMNKDQYEAFIGALLAGEKTDFKQWEKDTPYFNGCLPIEVMAERGRETLRHGPMKPRGLTNAHKPEDKPYAVVQLRQDNALGTLFNMVGFQTKLKYGVQKDIFRMIPGLERAEFARLGGLHRNTFIKSPLLLDSFLRLRTDPNLFFAGQMTGCEGYVESAATGLMVGRFLADSLAGKEPSAPPATTACGALLNHITGGHLLFDDDPEAENQPSSYQPMNINFGLFPPLSKADMPDAGEKRLKGKEKSFARKRAMSARALRDFQAWLEQQDQQIAAE